MENFKEKLEYSSAKERVQKLKKFYISLGMFLLVFAAYHFRKFYLTGDIVFIHQRNFSILFYIWGIILAIKAARLFIFNANWERKMLNKQLNQNSHGKL